MAATGRRRRWLVAWCLRGAVLLLTLGLLVMAFLITSMPGKSYDGPLAPLTAAEAALCDELQRDVETLAGQIGERNVYRPAALRAAAAHIHAEFRTACYLVERQDFRAHEVRCSNLAVEVAGAVRAAEILVIGAHYDTVSGSPGANDNASGVAALLALARRFANRRAASTVRFVAFANEEFPFFHTGDMGSLHYAQRCRERGEAIVGMISLETMGYYSDQPGSQHYPPPFGLLYPSRGDFIGLVGNLRYRGLVRQVLGAFRRHARVPSAGAALPGFIREAAWSDHWAFWEQGYPALMVTDTAPFRYPHYHAAADTPDKLDYERLARVVAGLEQVIVELASGAGTGR